MIGWDRSVEKMWFHYNVEHLNNIVLPSLISVFATDLKKTR